MDAVVSNWLQNRVEAFYLSWILLLYRHWFSCHVGRVYISWEEGAGTCFFVMTLINPPTASDHIMWKAWNLPQFPRVEWVKQVFLSSIKRWTNPLTIGIPSIKIMVYRTFPNPLMWMSRCLHTLQFKLWPNSINIFAGFKYEGTFIVLENIWQSTLTGHLGCFFWTFPSSYGITTSSMVLKLLCWVQKLLLGFSFS